MPVGMWVMRTAEFGLVDVLSAGPRRAVGVDAAIGLVDVDLDAVVDHRIDPDRGEAGVTAGVRVERRNPHEAMHAELGLQPAVGVVALDDDGRRLDARFVASSLFDHLDVELAPLGPANVHAQEHARPVAALRAAGAGVDFEIGVVGVGLAGEQRLELAPLALGLQRLQRCEALRLGRCIALGLAEFDECRRVVEFALDLCERAEPVLQHRPLAHELLAGFRVVPEAGLFGFRVQFGQTPPRRVDVKDASSAARRTA